MGIKTYNPYTPSRRNMTGSDFSEITKTTPEKSLVTSLKKNAGRNNQGKITGTQIHNIELLPGKGGQLVRSAGLSAQLMAKEGKYATLRLPSGEMRMVPIQCRATIGVIGNGDHNLVNIGKAGRKRHMGVRPTVRGSVMNPNDHPHGGGEGKAPVGRPGPCTPWGKPALGLKTRKKNKQSNKMIVRRRDGRAIK